jgi:predicted Zn finger-like uncharacterized protein
MILQCDQCNTKFKLDDAKIKDGGVKVRCSKCKHVFLVTKDQQEGGDLDDILGGLGLETSESQTAPAPADDGPKTESVPPVQNGLSQLRDAFAEAGKDEAPKENVAEDKAFDFSDFNFEEEQSPVPGGEQEKPAKSYDLSDFDPEADDGPAVDPAVNAGGVAGNEPVPQGSTFEFDFDGGSEPEPPVGAAGPQAGTEDFGYNDFTFNEEPVLSQQKPGDSAPASGEVDFNEFSFEHLENAAGQAASEGGDTPPEPGAELDFGSFDFQAEDSSGEAVKAAAVPDFASETNEPFSGTASLGLDFLEKEGESFQQAQQPELDPGELPFQFGETGAEDTARQAAVTVSETPGQQVNAGLEAADIAGLTPGGSPGVEVAGKASTVEPGAKEEDLDFSFMDFGQEASPAPVAADKSPASLVHDLAGGDGRKEMQSPAAKPDFEDEYPPLSISSRRKSSSFFTFAGLGILLLLLVVAGTGTFFLKNRPELINKVGLGPVSKWLGIKSADEGHIAIKNPAGAFVVNKQAGELFVVTGVAVNEYRKPRASIQVKAILFSKNGAVAMQKTAYCGNQLSKEQLESLPADKLEAAMSNQFGDSLSNLGLQPGKEIPFVVIFSQVPQDVADFGVEAAGSTVAGQ